MSERGASGNDPAPKPDHCASCGAVLNGPFCHQCGERVLVDKDWSVSALISDAVSQLADLDSRLLRSLRWLVLRPGGLAGEFFAGRRVPYLRPLQLFVLANVVYFFVQSWAPFTGYNTPLASQIGQQIYSGIIPAEAWATDKASALNLGFAEFEEMYNVRSDVLARTLVFLMVPALALFLKLILFRQPNRPVEHTVVAIHYYAFELLIIFGVVASFWPHLVFAVFSLEALASYRSAAWVLMELGIEPIKGVYWYLTLRRFYGFARLPALALTLIVLAGLLLITFGYRLTLLLATLWSL